MSNEKVRSLAVSYVFGFVASALAAWAVCAMAPTKLKVPHSLRSPALQNDDAAAVLTVQP